MDIGKLDRGRELFVEIHAVREMIDKVERFELRGRAVTIHVNGTYCGMLSDTEVSLVKLRWMRRLQELEEEFAAL